jgi:Fe2+ transport system protein B
VSDFGFKIGIEGEKQFKNALREINQSFRVLGSEMKLVSSEFDKNDKSIQAITARNNQLNKEIDAQKEKVSTLEKALSNAATSFGENDRRTLSWQTQLNNANAELNNMERELKESQEEVKKLNREKLDKLVGGLKQAGEIAGKTLVAGLKAAAAAMAAIGAGAVATGKWIKDSLNVYADYEDSMKQVQATMGLTGVEGEEAFKKLSEAAKEAGASTRFSASESADALNYLALAGYDAEQAIDALPGVLTLAAAGGMDLAKASDLVTDSMAALGLEISDMDSYMDMMARTSQKSNTNRYLGIPLFLLAMWVVFQFTFTVGDPLIGWIEDFFEFLGGATGPWLEGLGVSSLISSLVVDGIIAGVGSVLVFFPNIFLLFFAISLLEDSGYMARAAYIMDRFMHTLGLHGKSFIPLLIGFGCNVPAIMATRTLENKRDRMITILINPLMSCTARLPVYILFTAAFFSAHQGLVVFSLYLLGLVLAVLMGMLFKRFLFKGETSHFVMELPPYRVPTLKGTLIHMWERGSIFIRKAGTIIFATVVLIWVLSSLPWGVEYASQESILGHIGSFVAPIFSPAGFGNWEAAVALIFGILAKEVVVGTLGVIYSVEGAGLTSVIAQYWTPLAAYAFMVMTLIYIPCIAVIGVIKRETNSWGWTGFAVGYSLVLGWLMAVLIYQVGMLFGLG